MTLLNCNFGVKLFLDSIATFNLRCQIGSGKVRDAMAKSPKIIKALNTWQAPEVLGIARTTFFARLRAGDFAPDVYIGTRAGFTRAGLRSKDRVREAVRALTPHQAAGVAGMSRPAFLKHVEAGRISPDVFIGDREGFSLALLVKFRNDRKKDGVKKRGPLPKRGK